jgi:CRP-like cAMP-binding protein
MSAQLRFPRDEQATRLRGIGLFSGCTKSELRDIASLQSDYAAEESDVLTEQGSQGDDFFIIVSGKANVIRNGVRVAQLGPGEFFGEMAPLDGGPRTATVVADTEMQLSVLSGRDFSLLLASFPTVARKILTEMSARIRRANEVIAGNRQTETGLAVKAR